MKALVLNKPGELIMGDMPKPVPGKNELLIKTKAATICTSDLIDIRENPFNIKLPVILGHEGAGIVEAMGEEVDGFRPGDEVTAHPVIHCGYCWSCKSGYMHLCDNMDHLGFNMGGVFAEYFVIRADRARKKPDSLSFAHSTLMEPVCVCIEAIERADVREGANVLIIGDGPFGIMMAKLCKSYRPAKIILSGRHDFRLSQAGAGVITINEKLVGNAAKAIMEATGSEGIDCAIQCAGGAAAVETSIEVLRSRGTLSLFSGVSSNTPVDLFKVHVKELSIKGSCNDMGYMDKALEMLCDSNLDLGSVITHTFPFDNWQEAFYQAEKGKSGGLKVSMLANANK